MKLLRPALPALVVAMVVLVVAWFGRSSDGKKALADCDAALIRGDRIDAIVFGRAAAEARCPWCSAAELGYAKLYAIARDAESKADDVTALTAWRAVRAASLSGTLFDRTEPRRERADAEIARLGHRIDVMNAAAGGSASPAATEDKLKAVLAPNPLPSTWAFVVLTVGGVLLLVGAMRSVRGLAAANVTIALTGVVVAVVGVLAF
ncbi:MAG: hypothetical protein U0270_35975 [Labilithrix sp.]